MREKNIEQTVVDYAKSKGILSYKFNSQSAIGVPDRIFMCDGNKIFFIEFKSPAGSLSTIQNYMIKKLREKGCVVYVVDDTEKGKEIIDEASQLPTESC
jgi:hypothetical protein